MNKGCFVALVLLMSAVGYANDFTTFSFQKADGTVEVLPAIGTKITFTNDALTAVHAKTHANMLLNSISFMCFGSPENAVGVESVLGENINLSVCHGTLQLTAPAGLSVRVLHITGQIISHSTSTGAQQEIASQLATGVYIVQVGSETLKTIVR